MQNDFFYCEDEGLPYQAPADWRKEVSHLAWPTMITALLALSTFCFASYFIS